jgi:undecaprenyl diphosphate synthase
MAEEETSSNTAATIWICVSYGGRAEIISAARAAAEAGPITEESLSRNLWTSGMPDPDVIIRTGGEKRLSGFLTWQSVYSELFYSATLVRRIHKGSECGRNHATVRQFQCGNSGNAQLINGSTHKRSTRHGAVARR